MKYREHLQLNRKTIIKMHEFKEEKVRYACFYSYEDKEIIVKRVYYFAETKWLEHVDEERYEDEIVVKYSSDPVIWNDDLEFFELIEDCTYFLGYWFSDVELSSSELLQQSKVEMIKEFSRSINRYLNYISNLIKSNDEQHVKTTQQKLF